MSKKKSLNPWPYAIVAWFVLFIWTMGAWITYAMRNNLELVRKDYYEQEIRYQQQIDRIHRTAAFRTDVKIAYVPAEETVTVTLPPEHAAAEAKGEIHFYRPSDAALDRRVDLAVPQGGPQKVDVTQLRHGFWRVNIHWSAGGEEYYYEQPLVLGTGR